MSVSVQVCVVYHTWAQVLLFPPSAQLLERALEVLSEGHLIGGTSCVCSQPTGGLPGGEIRRLRSGMGGRKWKGDSKDCALVVRVDVSGGGPLNWTETNTVCAPRKVHKVILGVDAVGVK